MDADDALSLKKHLDFDHYYDDEHIPQLELTPEEENFVAISREKARREWFVRTTTSPPA